MIIQGPAGSGKTELVKNLGQLLDRKIMMLGQTALAAGLIQGDTIMGCLKLMKK